MMLSVNEEFVLELSNYLNISNIVTSASQKQLIVNLVKRSSNSLRINILSSKETRSISHHKFKDKTMYLLNNKEAKLISGQVS